MRTAEGVRMRTEEEQVLEEALQELPPLSQVRTKLSTDAHAGKTGMPILQVVATKRPVLEVARE